MTSRSGRGAIAGMFAQSSAKGNLKPWVKMLVRLGYGAKGVIYLLIGGLALQLALGRGGRLTDSSGVLRTILDQPLGLPMLAAVAVGVLTYAGWEIVEHLWDTQRRGSDLRGWLARILGLIKGAAYGTVGWEALSIVLGERGGSQGADGYARDAMRWPLGDWALALVGAGIAIYGATQLWRAWQGRYDDDLDQSEMRRNGLAWTLHIGRAGIGARGVIFVLMGLALVRAGLGRRPEEASGMADSMWTVLSQPFGAWLLAATAAGLMCFGLFQLMHARWARL